MADQAFDPAFTALETDERAGLLVGSLFDALEAMAHFGSGEVHRMRIAKLLLAAQTQAAQDFRQRERRVADMKDHDTEPVYGSAALKGD
jgi:hypothetical protein